MKRRAEQNALAIATEGANLYDKFVGFSETLLDLGRNLGAATGKYEQAMNQLKTGRGSLIRRAETARIAGEGPNRFRPNWRIMTDGPDGEVASRSTDVIFRKRLFLSIFMYICAVENHVTN